MSYLEHFKLHSQPFSEHAARESLWEDARMQEGLSRLQHLVHSGLLGLVTGASGLGKSALLKRFMGEQSPQVCQTIYCHLAHLPTNGLLKLVLSQMGELPKRGKDKLYSQLLDRARRTEGTLLLVFDEAHLLSGDALVDLRLAGLFGDRSRAAAENLASWPRAHSPNPKAIRVYGHRQSDQRSLSAQTAIEGANSSLHRLSGRSSRR